jgi:membrane protein DedA with SNARE-associated domain
VRPAPAVRALALAGLVVPQVVTVLVQGVAPVLLRDAPLLLLVLQPVEPWSVLVSARVDPVLFVVVCVVVRLPSCVGDWYVGRWYGRGVLDRAAGRTRLLPVVERLFRRARLPLLVVYPGATVSVLAGATDLPLRRFVPFVLAGVLLSALLACLLTVVASGPLLAVVDAVQSHALLLGAGLLVLAVAAHLRRARHGGGESGHL